MRQPELSSRRSYPVAWTIVIRCFTACLTATSGKFSLSRMPPLDFLLELDGGNTSPVLRQLHWLPIQSRVNFKMACFVFSSLSGHASSYLSDDIHLVSEGPQRHLRSSTDRLCVVPHIYNTFGDRSFAVAGPRVWNSLPGYLRDEDITYSSFRRELKTYWFSCNRGAM